MDYRGSDGHYSSRLFTTYMAIVVIPLTTIVGSLYSPEGHLTKIQSSFGIEVIALSERGLTCDHC